MDFPREHEGSCGENATLGLNGLQNSDILLSNDIDIFPQFHSGSAT